MQADKKPQSKTVAFWLDQIDTYDSKFEPWAKRSKKIIKRYKDDRGSKSGSKFNILWSNVQTLKPALYASPPKPNIDRRFQDDDDLGRYASLVLERSVSYFVGKSIFNDSMSQATLDRLLCGRGTTWIRYVPTFKPVEQITEDAQMGTDDKEPAEELYTEDVVSDYVHWQEFGHTWARTWQEVRGVWRKVYLGRADLIKRFGEELGKEIPLDATPMGKEDVTTDVGNKATIYEIWDKSTRKAIWIHRNIEQPLDEVDDPLGLEGFFPCPKPVYATLTNDDLIPTPDFYLYQDQAMELDELTARIASITKSIKVAGVYDAAAQGVDRLLSESVENKLIPVEQWAVFAEKGGLKGVFSLLPMDEIVNTLQALYQARDAVKQVIYEITGISDIVRGSTNAAETATAQQIKGQYATLRLDDNQKDIARFAADMVRIMTEIIAEHFSLDTIKQLSGVKLLTSQEKQQLQIQQQQVATANQQAQAMGQPPQPTPPIPEEIAELMDMPSWEDVEALIRNNAARCFRIDIETNSTIKTDQEAEKAARVEFLTAAGGFMQQAIVMPPDLQPLAMEMLMFGVRGFKVSRELETSFETAMAKMKKQLKEPAPPQPDPAIAQAQADSQAKMAELQQTGQIEQVKIQSTSQIEQAKLASNTQIEQAKIQATLQEKQGAQALEIERLNFDKQQAAVGNEIALRKLALDEQKEAREMLKLQFEIASKKAEPEDDAEEVDEETDDKAEMMQAQANQALITALTAPKEIIRDGSGKVIGIKTIG
jgi:hypothetical protein